jgi:hypothetical protein
MAEKTFPVFPRGGGRGGVDRDKKVVPIGQRYRPFLSFQNTQYKVEKNYMYDMNRRLKKAESKLNLNR